MNILVIVDPNLKVPPKEYGGIERVAHTLIEEFISLGHSVTLLAGKGSTLSKGNLFFHKEPTKSLVSRIFRKIYFQFKSLIAYKNCDVVFNLGRLDYLIGLSKLNKPILHSFHNPITQDEIIYAEKLLNSRSAVHFISMHQRSTVKTNLSSYIIHNPLSKDIYYPSYVQGKYLVYLGRITKNKGVDIAVQVAIRSKMRLIIAGIIPNENGANEFFQQEIEPFIDNDQIKFIGAVNDNQKQTLISNAIALLFPIRWNEPFGMVMIESLACGTPVIASNRASVPEIIEHGLTGYICNEGPDIIESFISALNKIEYINRKICRQRFIEKFEAKTISSNMLEVLESIKSS